MDVFYPEVLDCFLTAFRSLLNNSLTAETHRSIALHITYSVFKAKDRPSGLRPMQSHGKQAPPTFGPIIRRSTAPVSSAMDGVEVPTSRALSRSEVGIKMLELYASILCEQDTANIKKFARTVTNKVRKCHSLIRLTDGASGYFIYSLKTSLLLSFLLRKYWRVS